MSLSAFNMDRVMQWQQRGSRDLKCETSCARVVFTFETVANAIIQFEGLRSSFIVIKLIYFFCPKVYLLSS